MQANILKTSAFSYQSQDKDKAGQQDKLKVCERNRHRWNMFMLLQACSCRLQLRATTCHNALVENTLFFEKVLRNNCRKTSRQLAIRAIPEVKNAGDGAKNWHRQAFPMKRQYNTERFKNGNIQLRVETTNKQESSARATWGEAPEPSEPSYHSMSGACPQHLRFVDWHAQGRTCHRNPRRDAFPQSQQPSRLVCEAKIAYSA